MFDRVIKEELKEYTIADKVLLIFNIILALLIIAFSRILIKTKLGASAMIMGLVLLGIIIILKTFKYWGPSN